jgi:signal transduction histidine kinase
VRVPGPFEAPFLRAQAYVADYFRDRVENPETGTISISGERYILLRAASMSVEFFDLVTSLYQDQGPDEARGVATNLLFDMAHAIGKADARSFHSRMGVTDLIEKLSAGPVHFSFSGWAFVDVFPESNPSPDDDFFLIYDHPYSFESDTWLARGRRSPFPVCVMNAGYSSGWSEESFGRPLVAVEITCQAAGGQHCRFIMAPPSRIEEHLARYTRKPGQRRRAGVRTPEARVSVPEFFQRKRLEDELRRSHEGLEKRVAERTAELTRANEQLRMEVAERRRAEAARDEFLSVAAHELKTPLTSLRGFAQVLLAQLDKAESPDRERLHMALTAIDRQSVKLSRLVSQLLDVSRMEAGQLALDRRAVDVMALLRGLCASLPPSTRGHTVSVDGPAEATAMADPVRLEQVLTNLLDNALKFSPDGGPVRLSVEQAAGELLIAIADRGIGIPAAHRRRVFDRYHQGEHRLGGMGLGLYISRQIVELHGGFLEAEEPPDGGTRMVVHLPAARE